MGWSEMVDQLQIALAQFIIALCAMMPVLRTLATVSGIDGFPGDPLAYKVGRSRLTSTPPTTSLMMTCPMW